MKTCLLLFWLNILTSVWCSPFFHLFIANANRFWGWREASRHLHRASLPSDTFKTIIWFFAIFQNSFKLYWLVNSKLQIKSNCYFNTEVMTENVFQKYIWHNFPRFIQMMKTMFHRWVFASFAAVIVCRFQTGRLAATSHSTSIKFILPDACLSGLEDKMEIKKMGRMREGLEGALTDLAFEAIWVFISSGINWLLNHWLPHFIHPLKAMREEQRWRPEFKTIHSTMVPPTGFLGHNHPGSGVCLPALAHNTFEKKNTRSESPCNSKQVCVRHDLYYSLWKQSYL